MRAALYARVSTHDQHTLALQMDALREFATRRRWTVTDAAQMRALAQQGLRQAAMARHLGLWRTSVRRVLMQQEGT